MNNELLGVTEAAHLIGVDVATIKRAAKSGRLPFAHKLPGRTGAYLFTSKAVEAFRQGRAA